VGEVRLNEGYLKTDLGKGLGWLGGGAKCIIIQSVQQQ
jgi:hypothetical protein